ncbi:Dixin Coiled-coil protein DIX1 [Triplophysa tibetana]|uniref:Dixin Coiled-coil protein DIX1 n=1 Tax=Triplophysa tibetana TaxID=1572043 RepID=A0A5A9PGP8_9TELE|nr:Dixin Coiled-coil protein DIX1 [Triplophysa tibetana]
MSHTYIAERKQQQLAGYVSWVNTQLRKKQGLTPVSDLRQDLRDGVVLAHLIEIVAGELLDGIHYVPQNDQEKKQNVEQVLLFVSSKRIRMPQTSAKDIVEGNLKSVMRLILALAAHFKPSSSANHRAVDGLSRSSTGSSANHRPHSTMAMAQNAAAALAAARQDASRPGRSVFHLRQEWSSRGYSADEDLDNSCLSVRALVQQYEGQRGTCEEDTEAISSAGLNSASPTHTPKDSVSLSEVNDGCENNNKSETVKSALCDQAVVQGHDGLAGGCNWEYKLCEQQEQLEREMQEARKNGVQSTDQVSLTVNFALFARETQVVIRSRLDQSMEESQDLKDALQQRMAVQESSVLQLKQELLRTSMSKDELAGQNKELSQKDRLLLQQQMKLDDTQRKLADTSNQQASLQRELEHKDNILKELMSHEAQELSGSQNNGFSHPPVTTSKTREAEELQLVRDALRSLRNSFGGHDPQHHTLDTLEQGVASLMDRLYEQESHHKPERRVRENHYHHFSHIISCKWLGEVTLQDFKSAIDREGKYRYHFKALDPEFGTVKEEDLNESARIFEDYRKSVICAKRIID